MNPALFALSIASIACAAVLAAGGAFAVGQWLGGRGVRGGIRHAFDFARLS